MSPEQVLQVRDKIDFCPQPGPQIDFLSTPADITIMGGAAYVGKTWAEVYFPLRYVDRRGYTAAIYRQLQADITLPGGLWDEASGIYPHLQGDPNKHEWNWRFPSGASVKFGHATTDERVKGAQVSTLQFDELTHFEADFFWALSTRNRSTVRGVPAQILGTTNPDADSWVAEFLAPWIDQDPSSAGYGLPLPRMAGRVRYLVRVRGTCHWYPRRPGPAELLRLDPKAKPTWVKSVRFIPGQLHHNAIGLRTNPGYEGTLASADPVSVARLLDGNWKVRRVAGTLFKRAWFEDAESAPKMVRICRGWDLAATEGAGDWTVGVLLGQDADGYWWVLDVVRDRRDPGGVELLVRKTAEDDGQDVVQAFAWERAGAGKAQQHRYTVLLAGWSVVGETESGPPEVRAAAWSAQASQRRVKLLSRNWTREYVAELEAYPDGRHDDQLAATLASFRYLTGGLVGEIYSPTEIADALVEGQQRAREIDRATDFSGIGRMNHDDEEAEDEDDDSGGGFGW